MLTPQLGMVLKVLDDSVMGSLDPGMFPYNCKTDEQFLIVEYPGQFLTCVSLKTHKRVRFMYTDEMIIGMVRERDNNDPTMISFAVQKLPFVKVFEVVAEASC